MSTNPTQDQRGIVSLMLTLIMMVVISLIVIGFSQVARRNQREQLDRQLSTQAYYAAETGINDTVNLIKAGTVTYGPTDDTNCASFMTSNSLTGKSTLSATAGVKYTCLLINSKPTSINYSTVAEQQSVVAPLNLSGNLGSLTFKWKPPTGLAGGPGGACAASVPTLPSKAVWGCNYALLRVDLTKPGAMDAASLANNTVTIYLKPSAALGVLTVNNFSAPGTRANILAAQCNAGSCTANINFIGGGTTYYMRLSAMYKDASTVNISGKTTAGVAETFSGAQIVVDSTGRAQDQIRRVQVRLPVQVSTLPTNALQTTGSICKTFVTGTGIPTPAATAGGLCP